MAKQLPSDITFEEWIKFIFDHPENEGKWYNRVDRDEWNTRARPLLSVKYMTTLFANAGTVLSQFSNLQLQHGLWFIADVSTSDHTVVLFNLENEVLLIDRVNCIHSILTLYTEIFAPRCSEYLSHQEPTHNPLNLVCYMWWDLLSAHYAANQPVRREMDDACFHVMNKILELESLACLESAIHGLGHWQRYYREKVKEIVDKFLNRNPDIDPNLREYALAAQGGHIQ